VCLIQVKAAGQPGYLIDPLALPSLAVLAPIMADASITKVLHGADYDVTTLKRDFAFSFAGLFDTMIAARLLGREAYGLQAVALAELGVALSKGGQKDDWSRRPLTPAQEQYALADVEHLVEIAARLTEQLVALGRLAWLREECDAVAELPAARRRQEPDAYQKMKGARDLKPRALAVLRELHAWREAMAEGTNIPPFKILQPTTLLAVAAKPPAPDALARLPELRRYPSEVPVLVAAIERALAVPDAELPRIAREAWTPVPADVAARVGALKTLRQKLAKEAGLDISIVLPQRLIDRVAESRPASTDALAEVEGFRRWRAEAWGAQILALL